MALGVFLPPPRVFFPLPGAWGGLSSVPAQFLAAEMSIEGKTAGELQQRPAPPPLPGLGRAGAAGGREAPPALLPLSVPARAALGAAALAEG